MTTQCCDKLPSQKQARSLHAMVEDIGFGKAQLLVCLVGGGVWFAEGAQILLISSILRSVAVEWELSATMCGSVVSIVFLGILFGNMLSGAYSDARGRREPIIMSCAGVFFFSIMGACSTSVSGLCVSQLFVGLSLGVGQPATQSLGAEVAPSAWRVAMCCATFAFLPFGQMYAASLLASEDPYLVHLRWRWLLAIGSIPSGIMSVISFLFLQESPYYLSGKDRLIEARDTLAAMAHSNGRPHVSVNVPPKIAPQANTRGQIEMLRENMSIVFGSKLFVTSVIIWFSCFVLNFSYWGLLYALPQVMMQSDVGSAPAAQLMVGGFVEMCSQIPSNLFVSRMTRKTSIKVYLALVVLCVNSFAFISFAPVIEENLWMSNLQMLSYWFIKLACCIGFVSIFLYATEIYPTSARTLGSSVSIAGGRLGSILAPLAFEIVCQREERNFVPFFLLIQFLCVVNFMMIFFLPFETAGSDLSDNVVCFREPAKVYAACRLPPVSA
eukprot:TRINITY_DN49976_c0_g1_i1.p1 TRINITY_DN49976_c0_g1~~TRINITY_DN49976_c0_g1_i1.p1  ORF type:complete len:497 (-),score=71.28 TRINITY_DN49976_c0_g1_i1:211-1701(-)